jgi:hypothetical protein
MSQLFWWLAGKVINEQIALKGLSTGRCLF